MQSTIELTGSQNQIMFEIQKIEVVKSAEQYKSALARVNVLIDKDPMPDSEEGKELELISLLIDSYEAIQFKFKSPDPVDAVIFRMTEQDLRQSDLIPYLGSRSRVSEFLARRRPLTVEMIRSLTVGLGIPAEVLIQDSLGPRSVVSLESQFEIDWEKFPVTEMKTRGWLALSKRVSDREKIQTALKSFISSAIGSSPGRVFAKRTVRGEAYSQSFFYALTAWQARVLQKASEPMFSARKSFEMSSLSDQFISDLVKLSADADGPIAALDKLRGIGISVVIESHLSKTKLDGAAMLSSLGKPVIGLTLRFDRVDNFWFTLLHELMHIKLHLSKPDDIFLDRLMDKESKEQVEIEANLAAQEYLIPRSVWRTAGVRINPSKRAILEFAEYLNIHPAIVAGRIQKESANYSVYADMVGHGLIKSKLVNDL
jgi:HTH-type transcriptional regulator / antitoxin HigA